MSKSEAEVREGLDAKGVIAEGEPFEEVETEECDASQAADIDYPRLQGCPGA